MSASIVSIFLKSMSGVMPFRILSSSLLAVSGVNFVIFCD